MKELDTMREKLREKQGLAAELLTQKFASIENASAYAGIMTDEIPRPLPIPNESYEKSIAKLSSEISHLRQIMGFLLFIGLLAGFILIISAQNVSVQMTEIQKTVKETKVEALAAHLADRLAPLEKELTEIKKMTGERQQESAKDMRKILSMMTELRSAFQDIKASAEDIKKMGGAITSLYLRVQDVEKEFSRFREYVAMKEMTASKAPAAAAPALALAQ